MVGLGVAFCAFGVVLLVWSWLIVYFFDCLELMFGVIVAGAVCWVTMLF